MSIIGFFRRRRSRAIRAAMQGADEARDAGDFRQAALLYEKVVDRFPKAKGAWLQLGNMLKDTGSFERAETAYRRALAIAGKDAEVYVQLGHLSKLRGDIPGARQHYAKAVELDPQRHDAARELERVKSVRVISSDSPDLPTSARVIFAQLQLAAAGRGY